MSEEEGAEDDKSGNEDKGLDFSKYLVKQAEKGDERNNYKEAKEPGAHDEEVGRKGHKLPTEEKPKKKEETKKRRPHVSNVKCPRCAKVFSKGRDSEVIRRVKNHLLTHVMDQMADHLSPKPYACSRCGKKHRDRTSLARHIAFQHRAIHEITDITPEELTFS